MTTETQTQITPSEEQERSKYAACWDNDAYRDFSPGERAVPRLLSLDPCPIDGVGTIVAFGAGCGRAALMMHRMGKHVRMVDIAANCLDDKVAAVLANNLNIACLWDINQMAMIAPADMGYCADVMEHIPPNHVNAVLANITGITPRVVFTIAFFEDHFGKDIGETLHLTVKPFDWWLETLRNFGTLTHAIDMIDTGLFVLEVQE